VDTVVEDQVAGAIVGANLSEGWLGAFQFLLSVGGDAVNLAVTITNPRVEDLGIRRTLDAFLAARRSENRGRHRVEPISTVANTIFPQAWYRPSLGGGARAHAYQLAEDARRVSRRRNHSGTYFDRLVAWPGGEREFNQLEQSITRLADEHGRGRRSGNAYELGLVNSIADTGDEALVVHSPGVDNRIMGFPCLSHISLSLSHGRLHMAALYRNHEFLRRAYGNYLGLARLLAFIARESGWEVGELMCVSSHGTAEMGTGKGFGKMALLALAGDCRDAAGRSFAPACLWDVGPTADSREVPA
jgi:hypothetical protein